MKKLFLLDGMALIYRAHFALSKTPRFTSGGLNTSAVMGFTSTLLDVIKKEKPTHMAVVFDTDAPTERHVEYEAYKAHRETMPEDLSKALPYIFNVILGFNIPLITSDGYEADDIIGTLAKKAEAKGYEVYCMTPDKDFAQLVSENIKIYKPARMGNEMEILGVKEVCAKWEIDHVEQVIDILGLWGDAVDGIPGIPGVGEKTAKLLIKQYGSVSKNIDNVAHNYYLAETFEKRAALINTLKQQKSFCFDTETTGTDANNCELVGLSFSVKEFEGWYVPVPHDQAETQKIVDEFKEVMENPAISKVGQ